MRVIGGTRPPAPCLEDGRAPLLIDGEVLRRLVRLVHREVAGEQQLTPRPLEDGRVDAQITEAIARHDVGVVDVAAAGGRGDRLRDVVTSRTGVEGQLIVESADGAHNGDGRPVHDL